MRLQPVASTLLTIGGFLAVTFAESRRPLRRRVEPRLRHAARDVAVGALTALTTVILQRRLISPLTKQTGHRRSGLLPRLAMPKGLRVLGGILLLDYSLWWWHLLNHRVPFLWRFHRVHHVDLDLDSVTGLRFHFGEMALAAVFRSLQLRIIGPEPEAVAIWQTLLQISIVFHHSNTRLDPKLEQWLVGIIVTPRMHGIHHSDFADESNSNWASLFTIWDRLHGTLRLDIPQEEVTIGVPAYSRPQDVTLGRIVVMPAFPTACDWYTPDGQPHLTRRSDGAE